LLVETSAMFNIVHVSICMLVDDYLDRRRDETEPPSGGKDVSDALKREVLDYIAERFGMYFDERYHVEMEMVRGIVEAKIESGYLARSLAARELAKEDVL
jgi:hypothetical protein